MYRQIYGQTDREIDKYSGVNNYIIIYYHRYNIQKKNGTYTMTVYYNNNRYRIRYLL